MQDIVVEGDVPACNSESTRSSSALVGIIESIIMASFVLMIEWRWGGFYDKIRIICNINLRLNAVSCITFPCSLMVFPREIMMRHATEFFMQSFTWDFEVALDGLTDPLNAQHLWYKVLSSCNGIFCNPCLVQMFDKICKTHARPRVGCFAGT